MNVDKNPELAFLRPAESPNQKSDNSAIEKGPLSREEIENLFKPEALAELSTAEYVELLRQVPPHFVVHITRQGYKETSSHHSGADKENFSRGFEGILETGGIQSSLDRILKEEKELTPEQIEEVLHSLGIPDEYKTRLEAKDRLRQLFSPVNPWIPNEYADKMAIHAAMDSVPHEYYGSERGNDIFVAYPSAFIASQYRFASQSGKIPQNFAPGEMSHDDRNDLWLFNKETNRGCLPLEAGVIFIPASAKVDPETGSKFLSEGKGTDQAISSREYWENYFKSKGERPKKIIFYEESDPNEALKNFIDQVYADSFPQMDLTGMFEDNKIDSRAEFAEQNFRDQYQKIVEGADVFLDEWYGKSDPVADFFSRWE